MEGVDSFIMKDGRDCNVKRGQGGEGDVKVWGVCVCVGGEGSYLLLDLFLSLVEYSV